MSNELLFLVAVGALVYGVVALVAVALRNARRERQRRATDEEPDA
jgi:cytochrome c-type biogenesis protein CcmH/NrfF